MVWRVLLCVVLGSFVGCRSADEIGTAVYVGRDMVRPYRPVDTLVHEEHVIERARFPAIDVHCHWTLTDDPAAMIAAMDERNVRAAVNLTSGHGEELDAFVAMFLKPAYDGRFILFLTLPFERIDEPGFTDWAVGEVERAHALGVKGLKVTKALGLYHRDSSGALVKIDDARLDPIWSKCGALKMPVLIHTADPAAFWQPVDARNERWMQLKRHPRWGFYGTDAPPRDELLAARNRVIERHPDTDFIGAHVANNAEDLERVSEELYRYPNLYCDISGRVAELGRQPYSARAFILNHADRVMFGTDRYPGRADQPRYRVYFRFLETADEYFDYHENDFPPTGEWKIYGVFLPDDVLKQVYYDNAAQVLGLSSTSEPQP